MAEIPKKIKILTLTHYFPPHAAGIEISAGQIISALEKKHDVDITWLASSAADAPVDTDNVTHKKYTASNIIERLWGVAFPIPSPYIFFLLFKEIKRHDVVHIHEYIYIAHIIAWIMSKMLRKQVVITQHIGNVPSHSLLRYPVGILNFSLGRICLGGASQTVFVSARVQTYFNRWIKYKTPPVTIYNGVDTKKFHPVAEEKKVRVRQHLGIDADKKVVLFVGRFVPKKGILLIKQLVPLYPDIHWLMVGWGNENPLEWGYDNISVMQGDQNIVANSYRAADMLLLPSVGEGFPLVVQEAMATGLPVLISSETLEGCPEVTPFVETVNIPDKDIVGTCKEKIDFILQGYSDKKRSEIRQFSLSQWSWDGCAARYAEIFKRLSTKVQHG